MTKLKQIGLVAVSCLASAGVARADLMVTETKLQDGTTNATRYGRAVAVHSNTVVAVGEFDTVVFFNNGGGWAQQGLIQGRTLNDGQSVDIEGDTIVAGLPQMGQAVVSVRTAGVWTAEQGINSTNGNFSTQYGASAGLSGDTAAIGNPQEQNASGQNKAGAVYVFVRNGGGWSEQARLIPAGHPAGAEFGRVLALDGDTLVIGARGEDLFRGAVYIFVRTGTTWTQQARLPGMSLGNAFGQSVSINGNSVAIGAPGENINGAAYVFTRSGVTWTQQRRFVPSGPNALQGFGYPVAISGDLLLIGNRLGGGTNGTAVVYSRVGTNWFEQGTISPSDATNDTFFAASIGLDGHRAAIGAPFDAPAGFFSGAVYVYDIEVTPPPPTCSLEPAEATNDVSDPNHAVTAIVTSNALPAAGVNVTFDIVSGPNTGATGTNTTDVAGQAVFQYTNNGATGTDLIRAISSIDTTCTATKVWTDTSIDLTVELAANFGTCSNTTKKVLCPVDATLTLHNKGSVYGLASVVLTNSCKPGAVPPSCKLKGTLAVTQFDLTGLPPHTLAFYLSMDTALDSGDSLMKELKLSKFLAALAKGKAIKLSLKLPKGVDFNGRHILAVVDNDNSVAESDEANNTSASNAIPALP